MIRRSIACAANVQTTVADWGRWRGDARRPAEPRADLRGDLAVGLARHAAL